MSNGALLVTNALGASANDRGPTCPPIPALAIKVMPRPAHTGPSFAPYGKEVLIVAPRLALPATSRSLWKFVRNAHGPALSATAMRVMTRGEKPRMDHGYASSIPATCKTRR